MLNKMLYEQEILHFENYKKKFENKLKTGQILDPNQYIKENDFIQNDQKEKINNYFNIVGLWDFLYPLLITDNLEELIIHNVDLCEIRTRDEIKFKKIDITQTELEMALQVLALKEAQSWNYLKSIPSFFCSLFGLSWRITLIHFSSSPKNQSKVFFRKITSDVFPIENFLKNPNEVNFVNNLIHNKSNIVLAGGTGSGKTSFLKSILSNCDESEHTVILEDTHELNIQRKNVTFFLENKELGHTLENYCHSSLRISPNRIVLGELRSKEIIPFILAMNCGHRGLLTTIHSNSAKDTFFRLATLLMLYGGQLNLTMELALKLICSNIQFIVYLKNKKVEEIIKVIGSEGSTPYFEKINV